MSAFVLPRLAAAAFGVCLFVGAAQARVEIDSSAAAVEPVPTPIVRLAPPREPAWPLVTGGIAAGASDGPSFAPYALSNLLSAPAPIVLRSPPRDDTSRLNAQRSLMRAHAFSRNLYRPVDRDQVRVLLWSDW